MSRGRGKDDDFGKTPWGDTPQKKKADFGVSPNDRELSEKEELMLALKVDEEEFARLFEQKKEDLIQERMDDPHNENKVTKENVYEALRLDIKNPEPTQAPKYKAPEPRGEKIIPPVKVEESKRSKEIARAQAFTREQAKNNKVIAQPKVDDDFKAFKEILIGKLMKYAEGLGVKIHKMRAIEVRYAIEKAQSKDIVFKILDTQLKVLKGVEVKYDQTLGVSQRFAKSENVKGKVRTKLDEWGSGYWKIIKEAHDMDMQEYLKKAGKETVIPSKSPKF